MAVAGVSITSSRGEPEPPVDGFARGDESGGIKLGIRLDTVSSNLFSFTTVATNVTKRTILIAAGDSWDGRVMPHYTIGNAKTEWRISPPHVVNAGFGVTPVPRRQALVLKPKSSEVLHQSTFVPPVPAGKWKVHAGFRPLAEDRTRRDLREWYQREGVLMGGFYDSGVAALTIRKTNQTEILVAPSEDGL